MCYTFLYEYVKVIILFTCKIDDRNFFSFLSVFFFKILRNLSLRCAKIHTEELKATQIEHKFACKNL